MKVEMLPKEAWKIDPEKAALVVVDMQRAFVDEGAPREGYKAREIVPGINELAKEAGVKKPGVCISELAIPNAFAFGRTHSDARVCVTRGIMKLLNRDELEAVLGHEIAHVKHRDMIMITLLSVLPMICHYIAISFMWSGMFGGRGRGGGQGGNITPTGKVSD